MWWTVSLQLLKIIEQMNKCWLLRWRRAFVIGWAPERYCLVIPSVCLQVLTHSLHGAEFSASQEIPGLYGTRSFITAFTSTRHLSHPEPARSSPHSHITLPEDPSSHLCLGLPSGLFPSDFPTNTLYTPLLSPTHATCPAYLILLYLINRTILGQQYTW